MRKLLNITKISLVALALGSAANATPLVTAPAVVAAGINIEYYSDATYTNMVGAFVRNCNGIYRWGQVTEYKIVSYDEC